MIRSVAVLFVKLKFQVLHAKLEICKLNELFHDRREPTKGSSVKLIIPIAQRIGINEFGFAELSAMRRFG